MFDPKGLIGKPEHEAILLVENAGLRHFLLWDIERKPNLEEDWVYLVRDRHRIIIEAIYTKGVDVAWFVRQAELGIDTFRRHYDPRNPASHDTDSLEAVIQLLKTARTELMERRKRARTRPRTTSRIYTG